MGHEVTISNNKNCKNGQSWDSRSLSILRGCYPNSRVPFSISVQTDKVFRFWRAIEACIPQKADKADPSSASAPIYKIPAGLAQFPWTSQEHLAKRIHPKQVWRYTLQCGLYDISALCKWIEDKIGAHEDVYGEGRPAGDSRLFDLNFDEGGYPLAQSFNLSLACWSAGQILHHPDGIAVLESGGAGVSTRLPDPEVGTPSPQTGFDAFDALSVRLTQWLIHEADRQRIAETPPDQAWLDDFTLRVAEYCLLPGTLVRPVHVAKCVQVKRPEAGESNSSTPENAASQADGLLNSFFVDDLKTLSEAWEQGRYGTGLREYIGAAANAGCARVDVRTEQGVQAAFDALRPDRMPQGCWPSEFPLAFSQQLAVNELWRRLGDSAGIFAVNGPPGTGKTTLLRDVVAAVVTARAERLIAAGDEAFGAKKTIKLGDTWVGYHLLHPELHGHSIVVASSNNGAVENISLELPGINAVPTALAQTLSPPTQTRPDHYAGLASNVLGKPAWGLLAARLGSKANRSEFMNRFWWSKPPEASAAEPRSGADEIPFANGKEGLRYHLSRIQKKNRLPALSWQAAVASFEKARATEQRLRQQLADASALPGQVDTLVEHAAQLDLSVRRSNEELGAIRRQFDQLAGEKADKEREILVLSADLADATRYLERHDAAKPGLLIWLATLGRAHRQWWNQRLTISGHHSKARADHKRADNDLRGIGDKHKSTHARVSQLEDQCSRERNAHAQALSSAQEARLRLESAVKALGNAWPLYHGAEAARELSSPWLESNWRQAREEMFLAALTVHRAFIEDHPVQMMANLGLASDWLAGKSMPEEQARLALESLCLVVPVLSTTFASMPRMFRQASSEAIGWLLIDEAGQALPQHAAGAIWRARRTVVVGDPNQLEPVLALPTGLQGALARHFGISRAWWPGDTSAQRLADQTMSMGTWLPGQGTEEIWVGSPLRVHRRCDDPMFSISNEIAYDGLMVHGKPPKPKAYPACHWTDVRAETGEGNWVPEEGRAASNLVRELISRASVPAEDIFLISPFKDCAAKLRELATRFGLDPRKTGTIHTTQGKEADVVILVLGGNPQRHGAKDWAAQKPNLLNVAVSRAKSRLYVIGDRAAWGQRPHFEVLAEQIPSIPETVQAHERPIDYLSGQ